MSTATPHTAQMPALTVRRLGIDLTPAFARHWNGGDAFLTAYFNALSMSFPVGEQFFIDAVRAGAEHLDTQPRHDALRETVRGFIGQEATHRHLHAQFNAHLDAQGLSNRWQARILFRIARIRRLLKDNPKAHLHELAITAAYEHFTAVLGDEVIRHIDTSGDWLAQADEPVRTLWRWHAAEESEHKAVAFDLYQQLGGNHAWRVRWFVVIAFNFSTDVLRQTINNLWHDRSLFKPSTWWSGLNFALGRHGVVWRCTLPLLAYVRRDFHPRQHGHDALVQSWLASHSDQWRAVSASHTTP